MLKLCTCVNIGFLTVLLQQLGHISGQGNTTTTLQPAVFAFSDREKDGFPAWLVGVIVLSALAVIIAAVTVVQRILRRRARNSEQYRVSS